MGYSVFMLPGVVAHFLRRKYHPEESFPVTRKRFVLAVLLSVWVTVFGAWSWYLSLPLTTVAANNAIYQSSSMFVFLFSALLLGERVTVSKLLAVLVSSSGIVLVALGGANTENKNAHPTPMGYVWVVISTALYSLYEVLYKMMIETPHPDAAPRADARPLLRAVAAHTDSARHDPLHHSALEVAKSSSSSSSSSKDGLGSSRHARLVEHTEHTEPTDPIERAEHVEHAEHIVREGEGAADSSSSAPASILLQAEMSLLFVGCKGLCAIVTLWPIFLIFDATGVETTVWPDSENLEMLMGNAAMDGVFNASLLYGILVTSPLFMAVGSMLVVPAGIVVDRIVHDTRLSAESIVGIGLIVVGFAILKVPDAFWTRLWARIRGRGAPTHTAIGDDNGDGDGDGDDNGNGDGEDELRRPPLERTQTG